MGNESSVFSKCMVDGNVCSLVLKDVFNKFFLTIKKLLKCPECVNFYAHLISESSTVSVSFTFNACHSLLISSVVFKRRKSL